MQSTSIKSLKRLAKALKVQAGKLLPQETRTRTGEITYDVKSMPYCPKCKAKLIQRSECGLFCDLCEDYYEADPSISHVASLSSKAFNAKIKEGWKIEILDLPPGIVKSEDENEDFWVKARLG